MVLFKASAAFAATALLCAVATQADAAPASAGLDHVVITSTPTGARLVIETSSALKPKVFFINGDKPRFVLDVRSSPSAAPARAIDPSVTGVANGPCGAVRVTEPTLIGSTTTTTG